MISVIIINYIRYPLRETFMRTLMRVPKLSHLVEERESMRLKRSFAGGVACIAVLASLSAAQGSAFGGSTLNDPKGPVPYARQVSTSSTRRTLSGTAPEWSRQGT